MTALFVKMSGKESTPATLIVWVALPAGYHVFVLLIDLVKYATDASPYRMFPKVVVSPRTIDNLAAARSLD